MDPYITLMSKPYMHMFVHMYAFNNLSGLVEINTHVSLGKKKIILERGLTIQPTDE